PRASRRPGRTEAPSRGGGGDASRVGGPRVSRTVCVVVTARPSYSRIRSALFAIRAHGDLRLQLVVAASALLDRYGDMVRVIEQDGFEIDHRVYMVVEGENLVTMAKTTGLGLL